MAWCRQTRVILRHGQGAQIPCDANLFPIETQSGNQNCYSTYNHIPSCLVCGQRLLVSGVRKKLTDKSENSHWVDKVLYHSDYSTVLQLDLTWIIVSRTMRYLPNSLGLQRLNYKVIAYDKEPYIIH